MEGERVRTLPETRSAQDIALAHETLLFVQVSMEEKALSRCSDCASLARAFPSRAEGESSAQLARGGKLIFFWRANATVSATTICGRWF